MHDTTFFETQGIPSVFILSTEFVSAANAQSEALGMPELRRVFVEQRHREQMEGFDAVE